MSGAPRVCAVVVTHNRQALLRECLEAVRGQTRAPEELVVVDNASTDGTSEMLATEMPEVPVLRLTHNGGSAGGFEAGVARALQGGADWLWLLDDDTIARPSALAELVRVLEESTHLPRPALLASRALWVDGTLHPMNWPWLRLDPQATLVDAAQRRLMHIRAATYVSILVRREAVATWGPPRRDYFIWGDDVEFTARLLRHGTGYFVPESVVVHKTETNYTPGRSTSSRYRYDVRNKVWMLRGDALEPREKLWFALTAFFGITEYLRFNAFAPRAVLTVSKGLLEGLRRRPR